MIMLFCSGRSFFIMRIRMSCTVLTNAYGVIEMTRRYNAVKSCRQARLQFERYLEQAKKAKQESEERISSRYT